MVLSVRESALRLPWRIADCIRLAAPGAGADRCKPDPALRRLAADSPGVAQPSGGADSGNVTPHRDPRPGGALHGHRNPPARPGRPATFDASVRTRNQPEA